MCYVYVIAITLYIVFGENYSQIRWDKLQLDTKGQAHTNTRTSVHNVFHKEICSEEILASSDRSLHYTGLQSG